MYPNFQAISTQMNSSTDTPIRIVSARAMRLFLAACSVSEPASCPDERSMKYPAAANAPKMTMNTSAKTMLIEGIMA